MAAHLRLEFFATVVAVSLGALEPPTGGIPGLHRGHAADVVVALIGTWLHISFNLTSEGVIVGDASARRPLHGPLLFAAHRRIGPGGPADPRESRERAVR